MSMDIDGEELTCFEMAPDGGSFSLTAEQCNDICGSDETAAEVRSRIAPVN